MVKTQAGLQRDRKHSRRTRARATFNDETTTTTAREPLDMIGLHWYRIAMHVNSFAYAWPSGAERTVVNEVDWINGWLTTAY